MNFEVAWMQNLENLFASWLFILVFITFVLQNWRWQWLTILNFRHLKLIFLFFLLFWRDNLYLLFRRLRNYVSLMNFTWLLLGSLRILLRIKWYWVWLTHCRILLNTVLWPLIHQIYFTIDKLISSIFCTTN